MTALHPRPSELIAASLDGPLTATERSEVEQHTLGCPSCRRLEHQLRADSAALAVPLLVTPPVAIRHEIERRVAIPPVDPGLLRAIRIGVITVLALLVIVTVAIALALVQPRPTTPEQTREPQPAGLHRSEGSW